MRLSCVGIRLLRGGPYTATLAPEAGGRIASLRWHGPGEPRDLLVPWSGQSFGEHDWPKAGVFVMAPFANRLPAGRVALAGRWVALEAGVAGFAQHGFVHRRPWHEVEVTAAAATLRYVHEANPGWPWSFCCEQHIRLDEAGLHVELTLRNDSAEPMPFSAGLHPYLCVAATLGPEALQFSAAGRHELDENGGACRGALVPSPQTAVTPGGTAAFSGWSGDFTLDAGPGRVISSSTGAHALVLHRPASGRYVCPEPVSLLPGRLAEARQAPDALLAAGRAFRMGWRCAWVPQVASP